MSAPSERDLSNGSYTNFMHGGVDVDVSETPQGAHSLAGMTSPQGEAMSCESVDPPRVRDARTARFVEWRANQLEVNFRSAISAWRKRAIKAEQMLSVPCGVVAARHWLDELVSRMGEVTQSYERYLTLPAETRETDLFERYDSIETENHRLIRLLSELARDNASDVKSTKSSRSKRSALSHSSKHSQASTASKRIDAAADAAVLKAKFKCMELIETKRMELERKKAEFDREKAEFDRLKVFEELSMAEARLKAIASEGNTDLDNKPTPPTNSVSSAEAVERYLVKSEACSTDLKKSAIAAEQRNRANSSQTQFPNREQGDERAPSCVDTSERTIPQTREAFYPNINADEFYPPHEDLEADNRYVYPESQVKFKPRVNGEYVNGQAEVAHGAEQPDTNSHLRDLLIVLSEQVSIGRLPTPEPGIFVGDPLAYPTWKSSFDILIGHKGLPPAEKIFYLKKYLGGEAREAVEGYFLLSSNDAYRQAVGLLESRYGNPFVVANAFRDKLESWPKVPNRDGQALRKFADFLQQCLAAKASIGSLRCLDDERENRKLLKKLPEWLVLRWGRKVAECKHRDGAFPLFEEFVSLVVQEADIACDPIISLQTGQSKPIQSERFSKTRKFDQYANSGASTFATDTNEAADKQNDHQIVTCECCNRKHHVNDCRIFLKKSVVERKQFAKDKGLCFACLGKGHRSKWCQNRKVCKICSYKHPTSLHGDRRDNAGNGSVSTGSGKPSYSGAAFATKLNEDQELGVTGKSSMIVPVFLSHEGDPQSELLVYALLDTQSDTTFVLEDSCDALNLSGVPVKLRLSTMSTCDEMIDSRKVSGLKVRGYNADVSVPIPTAYTRGMIPANRSHIPTPEMAVKWPHLSRIASELKPLMDVPVALLIGYNCSQALMPRDVIPAADNGPYGQRTDLGWGIVGIVDGTNDVYRTEPIGVSHHVLSPHRFPHSPDSPADVNASTFEGESVIVFRTSVKEVINPADVTRMMELDFNDGKSRRSAFSQEDREFLSKMSLGIHVRDDGHYEMPLPFRKDDPRLPDNKQMAFHRLMLLKRRFEANPVYRKDYVTFMEQVISGGHAERVPDEEVCAARGKVWYIPHHGVYHPKKPSKIRVVFDCSAKCKGVSLNDQLLQGPDLTNGLQGVLCRFRLEHVAFMCDIKQMFHQFNVDPEHRDFLRFLWWAEGDYNSTPIEYRMTVHLFGAVSSPSCANFGLRQTADDNEDGFGSKAANFIRRDFYVDDGLKATASATDAIELIRDSKGLCLRAGLKLHKFVTNCKEVLVAIPPQERADAGRFVDLIETGPVERALGVEWAIESDTFQFRIVLKDTPLTRRGILSTVSSVYDPLGFVAPVVLVGKQILQQLCLDKCGWDDPVSEVLRPLWEEWRAGLVLLKDLQVKRCVKGDGFGKVKVAELHHFSDASTRGYGQCSYLRLVDEQRNVACSLVIGKSRVTPLKPVTIPRLELTAALVSVKVSGFLHEELLEASEELADAAEFFWTDSKVVLGYVHVANETRRFHVFVANRVQQIRDHTSPSQWHYVKTESNPADDASRGVTAENLVHKSRWISGPEFLWDADFQLGSDESEFPVSSEDPEVKSSFAVVARPMSYGLDLDRLRLFSSWNRMVRAIANCLRYLHLLQSLVQQNTRCKTRASKSKPQIEPLTVSVMKAAECVIIRRVQSEAFSDEISSLAGENMTKDDRKDARQRKVSLRRIGALGNLDPFVDSERVLRVGGRLRRSSLSVEMAHPIILPRKGHVTEVLVRHCHEQVEHQGRGMTVNQVRSCGFWVLGCSAVVSEVIHKCVLCRKRRRPMENQKMAELPSDRVEPAPPFTYCATDLFGPWVIKEGRKELKRYGVLFTCMASRAIHLETVNSLNTDSFINALRRFMAIRGPVRQLRSDRGTNFIGAERELREAYSEMDHNKVHAFLMKERCDFVEFKTNVPSASHMGGVWERQIRTVRSVLTSLLGSAGGQLDDESLRTFMHEAASIVNSRPLTVNNLNDPTCEPLTPSHLLTMKTRVVLPPPGEFQRADLYCRKRWRRVQHLLNEFWYRWRREYLQTLQIRPKWNKVQRDLQIGDVVLIKDENLPRGHWPLALVLEVFPSADARVRKVRLSVGDSALDDGGRRVRAASVLDRPIHKLVLVLPKDAVAS